MLHHEWTQGRVWQHIKYTQAVCVGRYKRAIRSASRRQASKQFYSPVTWSEQVSKSLSKSSSRLASRQSWADEQARKFLLLSYSSRVKSEAIITLDKVQACCIDRYTYANGLLNQQSNKRTTWSDQLASVKAETSRQVIHGWEKLKHKACKWWIFTLECFHHHE